MSFDEAINDLSKVGLYALLRERASTFMLAAGVLEFLESREGGI